ncbi:MAG: ABC transporter permease, partial [Myxococcota bacterium]|nr:ABC transporter permease [Myxococcota bacterium]
MEALTGIWSAIEALGSGLSLAFILAVVLLMVGVGGVYVAAAFVVLGRFARAAIHPRVIAPVAGAFCLGFAALWIDYSEPALALASWSDWFQALLPRSLGLLGVSLAAMLLYRHALGRTVWPRMLVVVLLPALMGGIGAFLLGPRASIAPDQAAVLGVLLMVLLGLLPLAAAGLIEVRNRAEWFIATRYLVAERRQVFISAITLICVGAVAAGVWLIITVLSVMNGFERTWREEIVGNYAHFLVRSYYGEVLEPGPIVARIEGVEGVVAASPFIEAEGMVRTSQGTIAPLRLRGIDPARAVAVTSLAERVLAGSLDDLRAEGPGEASSLPGLMIGNALAQALEADPGDELVLISPHGGQVTPLGPAPRLLRFR